LLVGQGLLQKGYENIGNVVVLIIAPWLYATTCACAMTWPGCQRIPLGDSAANRLQGGDPRRMERILAFNESELEIEVDISQVTGTLCLS